ncbi:hypothetical protein AAMO2058_001585500 [Amorphochlora amoebiformis]
MITRTERGKKASKKASRARIRVLMAALSCLAISLAETRARISGRLGRGKKTWGSKYLCEVCNVWTMDTRQAIEEHEGGVKHKENSEKYHENRHLYDARERERNETDRLIERLKSREEEMALMEDEVLARASGQYDPYEFDEETGYYYHWYWRHYYDKNSRYYWGGNPPDWTRKPKLPPQGMFGYTEKTSQEKAKAIQKKKDKHFHQQIDTTIKNLAKSGKAVNTHLIAVAGPDGHKWFEEKEREEENRKYKIQKELNDRIRNAILNEDETELRKINHWYGEKIGKKWSKEEQDEWVSQYMRKNKRSISMRARMENEAVAGFREGAKDEEIFNTLHEDKRRSSTFDSRTKHKNAHLLPFS